MAYTTIDDPSAYFQNKIYSGTGNSLALTFDGNSDMQPNWVWFKRRDGAANHHAYTSTTGVTAALVPNDTDVETTGSLEATNYFTSFNSNGFTLASGGYNNSNKANQTYASWNWKETADAGFDIITFTGNGSGRTISHSLGVKPTFYVVKNRDRATSWVVYHKMMGANYIAGLFNDASVSESTSGAFNNTEPTSSVLSIGSSHGTNSNGEKIICYAFADKQGYSKFGSYEGNGNADGAFIYTGFKPALVWIKNTDSGQNWVMFDSKRPGFNVTNDYMHLNTADAETDEDSLDLLSNGFKIRSSGTDRNGSGNKLIFFAWAKNPFVTSTGIPGTAQ